MLRLSQQHRNREEARAALSPVLSQIQKRQQTRTAKLLNKSSTPSIMTNGPTQNVANTNEPKHSVAGHTYTGSLRIPLLGEQFFHLDFSNDDLDTVHMTANGAVETIDDTFGYCFDNGSDIITFYPVEATKKAKKNNRLQRIVYQADEDVVNMVFCPPMSRKEVVASLHRKDPIH